MLLTMGTCQREPGNSVGWWGAFSWSSLLNAWVGEHFGGVMRGWCEHMMLVHDDVVFFT